MVDSGKPVCGSCGSVANTDPNTSDAVRPCSTDPSSCGGCSTGSSCNQSSCSCGNSNSSCSCGCSSQAAAAVCGEAGCTPCEEDHTNTTCVKVYNTTVKVTHSFNWPAVGESVSLALDTVCALLPGSVLWNQSVGYLHVQSFDATTGIAIAQYQGEAGSKDAGDLIPECTEFIVGIESVGCTTGSNNSAVVPYLDADFTAPAVGDCQLASVTNINGIALNDIISINSFQYRVSSIPDANTIELCNEGDGAPTGQVIKADANCDGVLDVQIVVLSSDDPCARDGVPQGILVVCDQVGIRRPFEGTIDGQVAVWDANSGLWVLVNSNILEECTALTSCATFDIGDTGPYVITVVSTAIFSVGATIVIGDGASAITATIQDIISGTQLRIILTAAPGVIIIFDPPTRVCVQDCCVDFADLVVRVNDIDDELDDTIRNACYPDQIISATEYPFNEVKLDFDPIDTGGGVYQRHYNYDDGNLPGVLTNRTYGPFPCKTLVKFEVYGTVTMAVLNSASVNDIFQFHDFTYDFNASDNWYPRQFAHNKGTDLFTKALEGGAPPVGFALEAYSFTSKRMNFSFSRVGGVEAGVPITARLLRRFSVDGPIDAVTWGGADHLEWEIRGLEVVSIFRIDN